MGTASKYDLGLGAHNRINFYCLQGSLYCLSNESTDNTTFRDLLLTTCITTL